MIVPSSTTTTDAESTHRRADADSDADADADGSIHPELLERIQRLEERVAAQDDRIEELEATNESLRETVATQTERIDELEEELDWTTDHLFRLEDTVLDDWTDSMILDELGYSSLGDAVLELTNTVSMDEVAALREKQITDYQSVKRDLARVRRQLTHVSEETDVELLDTVPGDDKIAKAVQDGIATSVTGQVTATYDRAELVLQNLADWGTVRAPTAEVT